MIFNKLTQKSKGYGFVAFSDPKEFLDALRSMNGKYVGSRPITLKRGDPPKAASKDDLRKMQQAAKKQKK